MNKEHTPVGAEARGRLRLWKAELDRTYRKFDAVFHDKTVHRFAGDFTERRGVGQQRALKKLRDSFAMTRFEGARLGHHPIAVWLVFHPRKSLCVDLPGVDPAKLQNCVTANYLLVGWMPDAPGYMSTGVWSVEVPDHALARLIQRGGVPGEALADAHYTLLRMQEDKIFPQHKYYASHSLLVRAGSGGFIGTMAAGHCVEDGVRSNVMFFRAATWIADEMLFEHQVVLAGDGTPGRRMVDHCLAPMPFRRIIEEDQQIQINVWTPGLPELKLVA